MKTITKKKLKENNVCNEGFEWYIEQKTTSISKLYRKALKDGKHDYIEWSLIKFMNDSQKIELCKFIAEKCFHVYCTPISKHILQYCRCVLKDLKDGTKNLSLSDDRDMYTNCVYVTETGIRPGSDISISKKIFIHLCEMCYGTEDIEIVDIHFESCIMLYSALVGCESISKEIIEHAIEIIEKGSMITSKKLDVAIRDYNKTFLKASKKKTMKKRVTKCNKIKTSQKPLKRSKSGVTILENLFE